MKLFKAIAKGFRKLFKKRTLLGDGSTQYSIARYISKKGGDIIPGDVPIPVSDELQCTLFKNDKYTYITMCIFEEILFFIPWHYNEFIIQVKNEDINFDTCTAEDIVRWMAKAVKWNLGTEMRPDDRYKSGTFHFMNNDKVITHSFSVDSGDYIYLKMNNIME